MSIELSVTEVRNALRCPRLFVLGRDRGGPVRFLVGRSSLGGLFHRIAARLPELIQASEAASLPPTTDGPHVVSVLEGTLLRALVVELETFPDVQSMTAEVDDLAEALRQLAAALVRACGPRTGTPAEALLRLLHGLEVPVSAEFETEVGPVRLSGKADALFLRGENRLEVVEYKLTPTEQRELDEAQVALYRHLLKLDGTDAEGVILRFEPALDETRVDPSAADARVTTELVPLLGKMAGWLTATDVPGPVVDDVCQVCPVRTECRARFSVLLPPRDLPPSGRTSVTVDRSGGPVSPKPAEIVPAGAGDDAGEGEARTAAERITAELKRLGVNAKIESHQVGPRIIHFRMSASSVKRLDGVARDIEHRLEGLEAKYVKESSRRRFEVKRRTPRTVFLSELLAAARGALEKSPGVFVAGQGVDGAPIIGDLSSPNCAHVLIAGVPGSGKSVLLRSLAKSLIHFFPPAELKLILMDPKRVTFTRFAAEVGSHLRNPLLVDVEDIRYVLDDLVEEMEARYQLFQKANVENLSEYNAGVKKAGDKEARLVVLIDEFGDLMSDRQAAKGFEQVVTRLGAKARAAGIHLVLATQRPTRQYIPPGLKAQLPGKIALRTASTLESRIILDTSDGAAELLGSGDFIANFEGTFMRGQAALDKPLGG